MLHFVSSEVERKGCGATILLLHYTTLQTPMFRWHDATEWSTLFRKLGTLLDTRAAGSRFGEL